jgi:hypothetical protein
MSKNIFFLIAVVAALFSTNLLAQQGRSCGTQIPSKEWDNWFNAEVAKFALKNQANKGQMVNYTIPVIVHIIHSGGAVGVGDNVSQAQVGDQINILNADFAGTGFNVGNLPVVFQPALANTNISWCLAVTDPSGAVLPEPGISRITATTIPGITNVPGSGFTTTQIDNTIKPATIWNPVQYCNIWILKLQNGLLGYATFPAGTTLPGVAGGGSATTDGVVCGHNYFGSIGTATAPPYQYGRTASHELGHWLGLRHIWGDGNCLTDYCNDTPWAKQSNFGCPPLPAYVNRCGAGQSPNGEMVMNFMDYTDDPCMYMFTNDQRTRMQTAMSQGTYRSLLGTHGLCTIATPSPMPATAIFSLDVEPCVGQPFTPQNSSTGGPSPTFNWMAFPGAAFFPNPNVASPAITFNSQGTYTLSLVATNSLGTSTYSQVIVNVTTCPKKPVCLDTLRMIRPDDTLTTYIAPSNSMVTACAGSLYTGYLTGTNCYKDKEFAQFLPGDTYSDTPNPQCNSVIVLFKKGATKATATTSATQIYCRVYGGSVQNGPVGLLTQISDSLGKIAATTATNQVQYCGNPNYIFTNTVVIPFKFNFTSPAIIPTNGFFASVETPFNSPSDSIQIYSNTKTCSTNDSSAWVLIQANNWRTLRWQKNARVQLAIMPQISCRPTGVPVQSSVFASNIQLVPNPNNGIFNLVFTLEQTENVKVRIYNAMGQLITDEAFTNVRNNILDIDLSGKAQGIYSVEVTNGKEKLVKKLIITQ